MPNRLVREGLMESEPVLSLPVEGRWLFVIVLLSADDLGLFEATEFKLARRADVNRDMAGKLLQMLADADLVRLYMAGDGKRYGFIPKFRQRVQIKTTKHPLPPAALYQDDEDALKKINDLAPKTTVGAPVGSGWPDDAQPSEAEVEVEEKKVSDVQNSSSSSHPRRRRKAADVPNCPYEQIVAAYHDKLPELPAVRVMKPGGPRHRAIGDMWRWVMTSTKGDGSRRATTAEQGVEWFRGYFERARSNEWVMGITPRGEGHEGWEADIDYLCSERGMKRVIEKTKERA